MSYSEPAATHRLRALRARPRVEPSPAGDVPRAARRRVRCCRLDGMGHVLTTKEAAMEAFRQPGGVLVGGDRRHPGDGFGATAHPAADRPARPREVPQDPRPAVRAAAHGRARGARRRAGQRPDRRVRRPRRVRLRRRVLGAAAVAGVPHAARPAARRPHAVPEDEGRHHPARPRRRQAARPRRHARVPERDRRVDLRLLRRTCSTSARWSAATTS